MSKSSQLNRTPTRPREEEDICPVCKSSRYLNPNMRFLLNPECYHKMCESCVDRIFSHGPAPCPVAGCHRTLRKQRFRKQTFEDIHVEKEVDVRRRVAKIFNRRLEEFHTLKDYNDYLEEIESMTFNLLNNVDVVKTEARLASYAAQNAASISHNVVLEQQETAHVEAHQAAEKEQARLRREAARREEEEERQKLHEGRREVLSKLASADVGQADEVAREGQRKVVMLKRSSARRNQQQAPPPSSTDPATSATDVPYLLKGLKIRPSPSSQESPPYDPFGGLSNRRDYFVPQDHYDHPWLDQARSDPHILAGGYDLREYYQRALVDAFSGLGVVVREEVAEREEG